MLRSSKTAKTAKVYSNPTGKKQYKDKYGKKTLTESQLINAAVAKQLGKVVETQYSMALFSVSPTAYSSVNYTTQQGYVTSPGMFGTGTNLVECFAFNMCYLSQTGPLTQPGWRQGQKIMAKSLTIGIDINEVLTAVDHTYHWAVVRRKNDAVNSSMYTKPTITDLGTMGLFKQLTDGPFGASGVPAYIPSTSNQLAGTATIPILMNPSMMRHNTDQWTFVKDGQGLIRSPAMPIGVVDMAGTPDAVISHHFSKKVYMDLNNEWDFVTRGGSDIKGGGYIFVMWREGGPDLMAATAASSAVSSLGGNNINLFFELAFKDG